MDVSQIRDDLIAEQRALDDVVSPLTDTQWAEATPSPRWTVAHQIAHLAYFDHSAMLAITEPDQFPALAAAMWRAVAGDDEALDTLTLDRYLAMSSAELLAAWRSDRALLADAAAVLDNDTRVPWYGPSMGAKSFLTARLMECWAHGQDIADAVHVVRTPTDRLRHIVQLGVITRGWSYKNRGLDLPAGDVYVSLTAPSGEAWTYGSESAERVTGSANDFCLVVTQRRHLDDTDLEATPLARDWLEKAQAFAGPATDGPPAGRFS